MTRRRKNSPALWLMAGLIAWLGAVVTTRASLADPAAAAKKAASAAEYSQSGATAPAEKPQEPTPPPAKPGTYASTGEKVCLDCHSGPKVTAILRTPHAMKGDAHSPFAQHQCESCHGASPEHIDKPNAKAVAVVFVGSSKSPVAVRNGMCLTCHESGLRVNWKGSKHQRNDVACDSCHTIHVDKDPVLVKTSQPAKCFTCHAEQRAQANRLSHHPIIEGKVTCADCHNPHGTAQDKMLIRARVNDTCYTCHAEKRGPFLHEHAPVREDCTLCHTPHGSSQTRLLRERTPYLCQQCHDTSHHSGSPYGGETYIGGRAPQPQASGKGCLNCHSQVHGSNNPSGAYLLR